VRRIYSRSRAIDLHAARTMICPTGYLETHASVRDSSDSCSDFSPSWTPLRPRSFSCCARRLGPRRGSPRSATGRCGSTAKACRAGAEDELMDAQAYERILPPLRARVTTSPVSIIWEFATGPRRSRPSSPPRPGKLAMSRLAAAARFVLAEFGPLIVFWALALTLGSNRRSQAPSSRSSPTPPGGSSSTSPSRGSTS
jgi:hypothetical protein